MATKRDKTMKRIDKVITVKFVQDYDFLKGFSRDSFTFCDEKRERFFIPVSGLQPCMKVPLNVLVTMVNLSHAGYRFKWGNYYNKRVR